MLYKITYFLEGDARPTQHDKGLLSEGSSTVQKKKKGSLATWNAIMLGHMLTLGCHAHNPEGSGGWGDDGSSWDFRAGGQQHTTHRGITLPVWMVHKKRWEEQWRGDKRGVEMVEMRENGTGLMQLNKTGLSAPLPGFRHMLASSKQINATSEKCWWKQWFPIFWRFTVGLLDVWSHPVHSHERSTRPHSSSWIRRHSGNICVHLYL